MGAIREYPIEFPVRTLYLLDSFRKGKVDYRYDVTLMMNCLLGLIVVAVENSNRKNLMPGNVDQGLLSVLPQKIKLRRQNKLVEVNSTYLKTIQKISLLKKIRNAIAHQNIKGINHNGIWAGVIFWNINELNLVNFEMTLSTDQLYNLATYISGHYLKKQNKKQANKR